jgi:hypothetical protein
MHKKHTCSLTFGFVWGTLPSSCKIRSFTTSKDRRETCRDGVGLPPVLERTGSCLAHLEYNSATHILGKGSCERVVILGFAAGGVIQGGILRIQ